MGKKLDKKTSIILESKELNLEDFSVQVSIKKNGYLDSEIDTA